MKQSEGNAMRQKQHTAFTMIELVMVIVVMGILAALALPRMDRDIRQEAADNILSAIRFAQHMALMDDVTNPSQSQWQRTYWRFGVRTCLASEGDVFYYVGSDKNKGGNIDQNEAAIDPSNSKRMLGNAGSSCRQGVQGKDISPQIYLSRLYGIKDTNMFALCGGGAGGAARYVGFDYQGRPHVGFSSADANISWNAPMTSDCNLTFQFEDTNLPDLKIQIKKETGYAYIVGQTGS
jgi:prepilin-type N-terminal cleavage/methylation domain-containing protein